MIMNSPFKRLAKKHVNKLYSELGEMTVCAFPYVASHTAQKLLQDKTFHNLLMEMVKEVVREDETYEVTKGKQGGVRKGKGRLWNSSKTKPISRDGLDEKR
jgi:hypothetical protein